MRRAPGVLRAIITVATATAIARTVTAQAPVRSTRISASVETGAAAIEQPLVRTGAAFYLAPSAQLTARDASIGGDAVLATGSPVWQSFLGSGFVRSPAMRGVRFTGTVQVLKTTGLLSTWHGDVGAEWRVSSPTIGATLSARIGQLRYSGEMWRDMDVGASATHSRGATLLAVEARYTDAMRPAGLQERLGISADATERFAVRTLDLTPRMIWERGRLRADASVALRAMEQGLRGTRAGPQLAFTFTTARGISLFAGGAQRLPDVRSGIPSGRSALLGLRIGGSRVFSRSVTASRAGPTLRVVNGMLLLDAGMTSVERASLRGDFTEWVPRNCHPRDSHSFYCGAAPAAGTWRVAIRLNDGAWQQPTNLAPAADDFGSVDGVLMTGGKP